MPTPEDQAFLDAIAADPDDDLPRLIYADWLDERGDPYGEFIRLQVDRARLEGAGKVPDWRERQRREWQLLVENDFFLPPEWIAAGLITSDPRTQRRVILPLFERGWLSGVRMEDLDFHAHDDLFVWTWPQDCRLCIRNALGFSIETLLQCMALCRVAGLQLPSYPTMPRLGVSMLANSPLLDGLKFLDLANTEITWREARDLVQSEYLQGLRELRVARWEVTESARPILVDHFADRLKFQ